MDLRSGQPFWLLKNGLLAAYPPLENDERCEVAIIGGGITGALIARQLIREGLDVVLVDKRDVGTGSTAASTSLLQYETDTELAPLIQKVGEAEAVRSYQLGLEAIDKIQSLVSELGDDCGFVRRDSLYLASRRSHVKRLETEFQCRQEKGFACRFLSANDVAERYPFSAPAAILSHGDAEVDAFRLTHKLLDSARAAGVRIYDRTEVTGFQHDEGMAQLSTDRKANVFARQIVFATGYESQQYVKQNIGGLHSTYAAVTEPLAPFPHWPERCLIWESARPYSYLRSTADDRIIIGGEDTSFASDHRQNRLLKRKTARLQARLESLFPGVRAEIAFAWAGVFGETEDGLAYIGKPPEWPNAYFAVGYGGNGITMSVIASEIIADSIVGRDNPDATIFRFDR